MRTAFLPQGSAINICSPCVNSSVGSPSEISTSTGGKARSVIGGIRNCSANIVNARPKSVTPSAAKLFHLNSSTGVGCETCHCAPLENANARTNTSALGFSSATLRMCGNDSRIALLSA
ncbi:hypothetical protein [Chromatium okenii]|uniref:hypothetical protein n=1 Tax=Chromatium okenii TaxID=61644 RepID=UPI0018D535B3|nr:hypothetical protein [Chromatium okenii]